MCSGFVYERKKEFTLSFSEQQLDVDGVSSTDRKLEPVFCVVTCAGLTRYLHARSDRFGRGLGVVGLKRVFATCRHGDGQVIGVFVRNLWSDSHGPGTRRGSDELNSLVVGRRSADVSNTSVFVAQG